jgi:DNA polymerase-3 subunit epsilon
VFDQPLVFLDVETTGAHPVYDRITEIGLVAVDPGGAREEFSTLLNPGVSIPPAIQSLTGITNDMIALAPRFEEVAGMLYGRLEGRLLIAHNARFDYGFLRNEFRRAGVRYASQVLCTVKLSRKLHPQEARHNLDAIMARYGIACEQRHRALGDARVLWQLAGLWARTLGADVVAAAARLLLRAPTVPAGLPDGALDGIPEAPGVYLFYGKNDAVLYVGKSVNLRSRVLSHFSGDHRDGRDMKIAQEVRRVDWIETAGELGALIEEARLVKELAPVYNRRLRRSVELCAWHWRAQAPADPPRLISARDLNPDDFSDLHGLFRSRSAAREALRALAAEHGLCPILLGLEKGRGPCFAHQIRRCRGACVGKETRVAHGLRLGQALTRLKMRPWPFAGRVAIRESGGAADSLIVLDRWCYLGTARSDAALHELLEHGPRPVFDLDTYRILTRFLLGSARPRCPVVPLPSAP